jgi:hypothetical protein
MAHQHQLEVGRLQLNDSVRRFCNDCRGSFASMTRRCAPPGGDAATAVRVERLARDSRRPNFTTLAGLGGCPRHRARATA